jgi:streptogramin lyase
MRLSIMPGLAGSCRVAARAAAASVLVAFTAVPVLATSAGAVTAAPAVTGIDYPWGIAAGIDGALWYTNYLGNSIGRITTGGQVTAYTGTGISSPVGIAQGGDGYMCSPTRVITRSAGSPPPGP